MNNLDQSHVYAINQRARREPENVHLTTKSARRLISKRQCAIEHSTNHSEWTKFQIFAGRTCALTWQPSILDLEQLQLFTSFVQATVRATVPGDYPREVPLSWINYMPIPSSGQAKASLQYIQTALGYGFVGHNDSSRQAVHEGRKYYSKALSSFRWTLNDDRSLPVVDKLAPMALLMLYEIKENGVDLQAGWLKHAEAIENVLKQASPYSFVNGDNHNIFLFCRIAITIKALLTRRHTVLADPSWLHVPWSTMTKTPLHELTDIATGIADMLESVDKLEAHQTVSASREKALLVSTAVLIMRLKQWRAHNFLDVPSRPPVLVPSAKGAILSMGDSVLRPHWYPSKFHDDTAKITLLHQARGMLFYWSLELCLQTCVFNSFGLYTQYKRVLRNCTAPSLPVKVRDDICCAISAEDATSCADNITSWFKFAAQNTWQSFGPAFGVLSLQTAIDWYMLCSSSKSKRRLGSLRSNTKGSLKDCHEMLTNLMRYGSPLAGYARSSS